MIENRRGLEWFSHVMLIAGALTILFPLYVALVTATLDRAQVFQTPMPLWPSDELWNNLRHVWQQGIGNGGIPFGRQLLNSLVMALVITVGTISVSMLSAFAIVYFRFPLRNLFFLVDIYYPDAAGGSAYLSDGGGDGRVAADG